MLTKVIITILLCVTSVFAGGFGSLNTYGTPRTVYVRPSIVARSHYRALPYTRPVYTYTLPYRYEVAHTRTMYRLSNPARYGGSLTSPRYSQVRTSNGIYRYYR
jgi:hypothetical protein